MPSFDSLELLHHQLKLPLHLRTEKRPCLVFPPLHVLRPAANEKIGFERQRCVDSLYRWVGGWVGGWRRRRRLDGSKEVLEEEATYSFHLDALRLGVGVLGFKFLGESSTHPAPEEGTKVVYPDSGSFSSSSLLIVCGR